MSGKRPTSADALRYFRATGNRAGADEILKAAVGKPSKMPEDYGSAFAKSGPSSSQSAEMAMMARQKEGPQIPAGAVKPSSSGIVSSSKEAIDKMPPMSVVPSIPGNRIPGGFRVSDKDMPNTPKMSMPAAGGPVQRGMMGSGFGSNPMPPAGGPDQRGMGLGALGNNPFGTAPRPGFAKGGSVKGSGCEQRGLRKCKVV
jgi:hypothetical protein